MKLNTLSAALLCALPMTGAFAAALDRSGQSISSFLQPNNYFEAGISALSADVQGQETDPNTGANRKIDDMAKDYVFANAAIKLQLNDKFSFGLIFDQPFGASAAYNGNNFFVAGQGINGADSVLPKGTLDAMAANKVNETVAALFGTETLKDPALEAKRNYIATSINAATEAQFTSTRNTQIAAQTPLAIQKFATDNLGGNLNQAQAMYNNNISPVAVGPGLADIINSKVQQGVDAALTANNVKEGIIRPTVVHTVKNVGANGQPSVTAQVQDEVKKAIDAVNGTVGAGGGSTKVSVTTENLSMLFGFSPIENVTFYAGPVYQSVQGKVSLRGDAYSIYNGYDATIDSTGGTGWLAGAAYQIPEIALKASLTYRSEIDHKADASDVTESISALSALPLLDAANGAAIANSIANSKGKTTITTPKSINLDLQSGIMANTVAFANIRWVNWQDFAIRPHQFGLLSNVVGQLPPINRPNGFNLVEYSEDQWSVTAGVGRKFNEKWAGNVAVGWDSGAGNPVSTLGPTEGYYNVGLGLQFSPAANYFVAGGVKYFWLGDAKAQTAAQAGSDASVANFEDNTAVAVGLKLGYRF